MKRLILIALLVATPVVAQQGDGQLPSETACAAVLERVQLALAQADRALQAEEDDGIDHWSTVAANYSTVYAAFCSLSAAQ